MYERSAAMLNCHQSCGTWHCSRSRRRHQKIKSTHANLFPVISTSDSTPLLDAVLQRGNQLHDKPFHVPGHKRGRALDPGMQQLLGVSDSSSGSSESSNERQHHNPLRFDLTEVAGLDYLSSPTGVIQAAQQLAAVTFSADHTWFLVNGCSVGIHAAVMATVKPGQTLLLARNCHLSAFAACVLADCNPLWLQPEQDATHGIAHCVTPEELQAGFEAAAAQGRSVGAVLLVSPTYYGAVARVREVAAVCAAQGVPLLVDEAHGGHLHFLHQQCSDAPESALSAGASVVMHSSHKVLTAMTQAAMLHCKGSSVQPDRINKALQVLQTSSPSYILLSSLDAARRHAAAPGSWSRPLAVAAAARSALVQLPGVSVVQHGSCGCEESVAGFDPLRLVVNVAGLGLTGFAAAEWLEQQHSIVPELATSQLVVFVVGPGSLMSDADALVEAVRDLATLHSAETGSSQAGVGGAAGPAHTVITTTNSNSGVVLPACRQQADMSPRAAFFADSELVELSRATDRISAELLCPYPPGVPAVFPGERFSIEIIDLLRRTLAEGGVVTGAKDPELHEVLVVTERALEQ